MTAILIINICKNLSRNNAKIAVIFCRRSAAGLQARDACRDIFSKINLNILTPQIRAAYTKHTVDVPDLTFSRNASNIEIVKILQRIADICICENEKSVFSNVLIGFTQLNEK